MSPSTNFGSASLWRHQPGNMPSMLKAKFGVNGFMLGNNRPYSRSYSVNYEVGEVYTLNDGKTRLDTPDYGAMWDPIDLKGMCCTFGSGRSGKGAGLIIPALLLYGGNMIVNDPKGQNAWITAARRRALNHKVAICDPFGEVNRAYGAKAGQTEQVTKFNPLRHLDARSINFAEDISGISEAITVVQHSGGENAGFFSGSARDFIEGVIAGVVVSSPPGQATFRKVRDVISLDDASFAKWVASLCLNFPGSLASRKLADFIDMNRTNQGVKKTAKEQTKFLDSEQILRYMEPGPNEPTFDFSELATGRITIYLVLPATLLTTQSRWLRLMINQALRAVLHARAKQATPCVFLLDEAGTSLGHLDEIENAYGLTSGMGVLVWSFYQDISQLQRDYPKSYNTFIGNSACLQLLEAKDPETSEFFSKYMGQKTIESTGRSSSESTGTSGGGQNNSSSSTSRSTNEMGRMLMTPDEIRSMPDTEMLVIYPKRGNFRQFKIEYYRDARFNNLYRIDPNEQKAFPAPRNFAMPSLPLEVDNASHTKQPSRFPIARIVKIALWLIVGYFILRVFGDMTGHTPYVTFVHDIKATGFFFVAALVAGYFLKTPSTQKQAVWWVSRSGHLNCSVPPWAR